MDRAAFASLKTKRAKLKKSARRTHARRDLSQIFHRLLLQQVSLVARGTASRNLDQYDQSVACRDSYSPATRRFGN